MQTRGQICQGKVSARNDADDLGQEEGGGGQEGSLADGQAGSWSLFVQTPFPARTKNICQMGVSELGVPYWGPYSREIMLFGGLYSGVPCFRKPADGTRRLQRVLMGWAFYELDITV